VIVLIRMILNYLCTPMKKFFFKSILFVSLVAFLMASNGVFYINHYCFKSEKNSTSFVRYYEDNCCESIDKCCVTDESHHRGVCCANGHNERTPDVSIGNEKCCKDQNYYLKVYSSYLLPDNSLLDFQSFLYACEIQEQIEITPYSHGIMSCNSPPPELNIPVFLKNRILRL